MGYIYFGLKPKFVVKHILIFTKTFLCRGFTERMSAAVEDSSGETERQRDRLIVRCCFIAPSQPATCLALQLMISALSRCPLVEKGGGSDL